ISGIGLALFQDLIPGAGMSTGLFMNARRVGAVLSGPIIAAGALPLLGQRGLFAICAVLTVLGLGVIPLAQRLAAPPAAEKSVTAWAPRRSAPVSRWWSDRRSPTGSRRPWPPPAQGCPADAAAPRSASRARRCTRT